MMMSNKITFQKRISSRFMSMISTRAPKVLFVLGGPAAGKGTQCIKLSNEYGMTHLSAGELLREEIATGSSNGKLIETYLKEGKIVPVQITLDLLREKMQSVSCNRFLVDGFPRNWDNVRGWESCMSEICEVEGVMFIDCPEEELQRRLLSRGESSGRSDDNIETAKKRFSTYKEATMPVIDYYESKGKLIRIGGDQNREKVFFDMKAAVVPFIEKEILTLTATLLDAISNKDWDVYSNLCDPSLTAFEGEAKGNLVEGLSFHKYYFDFAPPATSQDADGKIESTAQNPVVRVMGRSAVISYTRVIKTNSSEISTSSTSHEETRVWQLFDGVWKQVHIHRGPGSAKQEANPVVQNTLATA
jgi:UMP-CMP kinase